MLIIYLFRSQNSDSNNKRTPESTRRSFQATPLISIGSSISGINNKLMSEDYIDDTEFEVTTTNYKPEKPSNIFCIYYVKNDLFY